MKKIALLLLLTLSLNSLAQATLTKDQVLHEFQKNENSKSGNYKDILASFYQLATTNLTGDEKSIEFNSTLFALKAKANPELMQDVNFVKERFSRNFQFNFKVNLDDNLSYTGFSGGFSYAIINERDKQLAVLTSTLYGENYTNFMTVIEEIQSELLTNLTSVNRQQEMDLIEKATEDIINGISYEDTATNNYYSAISNRFKEKVQANSAFEAKEVKDFVTAFKQLKSNEYNAIDAKPLWTVAADGTADAEGRFNQASFGTVFLKGNKAASNEIDIRALLKYADTVAVTPMQRLDLTSTAGVNFKLARGKQNVSFFELKAAMEYKAVFKNRMEDEKQHQFFGNAEIRVRIAEDLWFPVIIKYDIENSNFLGFLNVSYNFENLFGKVMR
ncbi:MAG: hypothetical protein J0L86_13355 [Flavobacteriales bacterium]|nr:hypothetical protein [Flavobacteriales bacterium]